MGRRREEREFYKIDGGRGGVLCKIVGDFVFFFLFLQVAGFFSLFFASTRDGARGFFKGEGVWLPAVRGNRFAPDSNAAVYLCRIRIRIEHVSARNWERKTCFTKKFGRKYLWFSMWVGT